MKFFIYSFIIFQYSFNVFTISEFLKSSMDTRLRPPGPTAEMKYSYKLVVQDSRLIELVVKFSIYIDISSWQLVAGLGGGFGDFLLTMDDRFKFFTIRARAF